MSVVPPYIGVEIEPLLNWQGAINSIHHGHQLAQATIQDTLIENGQGQLLIRSCAINGLGLCTKAVTIFPDNQSQEPVLPTIQGALMLFDESTGRLDAIIDGALVTKWKTVADSLLAARILSNAAPKKLAILGSGAIAATLAFAYPEIFPSIQEVSLWSRNIHKAEEIVPENTRHDLSYQCHERPQDAVNQADVICCATSAKSPILFGDWVKDGAYIDLIGAHAKNMREANDELIMQSKIYVDSKHTAIDDIGELFIPLTNGIISRSDILGDLYNLCTDKKITHTKNDTLLFKNGGGAHLDLMIGRYIAQSLKASTSAPDMLAGH